MAAHPIGPRSAASQSLWNSSSAAHNRAYLGAAMRSGLIALVLLAILAAIVLF